MDWDQFQDLLNAFKQTSQSKGGFAALEGFSFQFLVSLLALVAKHGKGEEAGVFLETLSDLVERKHGGFLVVTQIKRTLSSAAIESAILDLWKINTLATSSAPRLQPKLRYRILGNRSGLKDIDRKIFDWSPKESFDVEALQAFKLRLRSEVEPDPLIELATRLAVDFAEPDPFGRAEAWLGLLLANPNPVGFETACASASTASQP